MSMRPLVCAVLLFGGCAASLGVVESDDSAPGSVASLRAAYSRPPSEWPPATIDPGVAFVELGRLPPPPKATEPAQLAAIQLGERLFFDGRLSGTGQMACASCHDADLGFADGRTTSLGHGALPLRRNAPSVLNSAYAEHLFWDGRARTLEDQALMVFENPDEMHGSAAAIVAVLASSRDYRGRFKAAFGDPEPTIERVLAALAAYERTIVSDGSSAFDRFVGGAREALSAPALRGLHLFRTKARCANCHHGPRLSDGLYHDLGLSYYGRKLEDLGRYRVTGAAADVGRFATPSLRNVARTAPYMHNGLFDLAGVVNMYSAGMATLQPNAAQQADPLFPKKSPLLQKLELSAEEKQDLLAFLDALTERRRRVRPPELPAIGDLQAGDR